MQREELENPLELQPPSDSIERIHVFARDLAWGAVNNIWSPIIGVTPMMSGELWASATDFVGGQKDPFKKFIGEKWHDTPPRASLMLSFGYFTIYNQTKSHTSYLLTSKSFVLLDSPILPPSVFISYKRDESSALGLLIEARLKLVDKNISVFIDKLLEPGDLWHAQLEEKVRQSRYFVCLLAPKSLGSKFVRNEIHWALDKVEKSDTVIIPVCHGGYSIGAELPDKLQKDEAEIKALLDQLGVNNAITINPESAEEYELAIIKILSKLGYSNI